jgi:ParB-like chromosome segregation protein Spo0J|tara:strand:+ start:3117 stop:4022 length:906 start_codon:yes stop_codon:yes gene_type:complete
MSKNVNLGFEFGAISVDLSNIMPSKVLPKTVKKTKKYKQIAISVAEIDLVAPLMVYPQKGAKGKYLLLDGHLRLEALKDLGRKQALCMIATDDESFTYNKRINRLAPIQEHFMIMKTIERGVSQERIAQVLGLNANRIRQKRTLLNGICPEVVDMLKDRHFPDGTMNVMKRVKPLRQVEMAQVMIDASNFSVSYARALLITTPRDQLVAPESKPPIKGITEDERLRMEQEMDNLQRSVKSVQEEYGTNVVRLVVANGYVTRLLRNDHVSKYLQRHHQELHTQLQEISDALAVEGGGPSKPL